MAEDIFIGARASGKSKKFLKLTEDLLGELAPRLKMHSGCANDLYALCMRARLLLTPQFR